MSFRLEMLQVARLAPQLLGEAADLVRAFLQRQVLPCGAFPDRDGCPDLYYTVFGMEALLALHAEPDWPLMTEWLREFGDGAGLDFIHLCCLARCHAAVPEKTVVLTGEQRESMLSRLAAWRTPDGGFNQRLNAPHCTAYGCLLGWAAHYDLKAPLPDAGTLTACLQALAVPGGGYGNEPGMPLGTVPATAAAVALHRHLRRTPPPGIGAWLLAQRHPEGGFLAAPGAPLPDLLSTAVALHALDGMQVSFAAHKEALLDYIDTLWSAEGGFHGHWAEDILDVEYTYYGLLALGHLAL
ncbi:MAG TPA: prenyltransferase/squalene oxidase repeat-containing protein [Verrucomicrobiales bacterium]|nr:prenyltransferase/squalene oxidase repeat-containing protein [Verrucomicrobiales bacterium]